MVEVYGVWHQGAIVYVGVTTKGISERMRKAKNYANGRRTEPYARWMVDHVPDGVERLDIVAMGRDARIAEAFWIQRLQPKLNANTYRSTVGDIENLYSKISPLSGGEATTR